MDPKIQFIKDMGPLMEALRDTEHLLVLCCTLRTALDRTSHLRLVFYPGTVNPHVQHIGRQPLAHLATAYIHPLSLSLTVQDSQGGS